MLVFDKARRLGCGEGVPILRGDDTAYLRLNTSQYALLPGFCDVHVHLREPGFFDLCQSAECTEKGRGQKPRLSAPERGTER